MTEQSSPDDLAEAERKLREFSGGNWDGSYYEENKAAGVVLKELARLRLVEQAATALTAHFNQGFYIESDEEMTAWQTAHDALCHALAAAVHGETP